MDPTYPAVKVSTYLGHTHISDTYWYLEATPTLMQDVASSCEAFDSGGGTMTPIASHIEAFLRDYLPTQRGASPHTCDTYAYSFKLLFIFASQRLKAATI